jgi:hypothetical protein
MGAYREVRTVVAMRAVAGLQPQLEPILWISEVRTIAADRL